MRVAASAPRRSRHAAPINATRCASALCWTWRPHTGWSAALCTVYADARTFEEVAVGRVDFKQSVDAAGKASALWTSVWVGYWFGGRKCETRGLWEL
jgi:hypothetical protein